MSITLLATDDVLLSEISKRLIQEGVEEVFSIKVSAILNGGKTVNNSDLVILILASQELAHAVELTSQIRKTLGQGQSLVLCMSHPTNRQLLLDQGADEIICTAGSKVEHCVDRILGHLILNKRVKPYACELLRGATKHMREIYSHIERFAPKDDPLLILGETGTGKELVAHALHSKSNRAGNFAPINLTEIPADLLASEMFGHEKGGFTNATHDRKGWIAEAQNGTVLFDEIGDLDMGMQVKLLRVVERNQVKSVGSDRLKDVNARFIFATHHDLEELIDEGRFREDLYQRIDVLRLELPPLRKRMADIPLLVEHFVEGYRKSKSLTLEPGAVDVLFRHEWRGNVRELYKVVRRAAALLDTGGIITDKLLQELIRQPEASRPKILKAFQEKNIIGFDPRSDTWTDVEHRVKAAYFKAITEAAGGSIVEAERLTGLSRSHIYALLDKYDLSLKRKPDPPEPEKQEPEPDDPD